MRVSCGVLALLSCLLVPAAGAAKATKKPGAAAPAPELPLAPLVPPPAADDAKVLTATQADAAPAPSAETAAPAAFDAAAAPRERFSVAPRAGLFVPRGALGLGPLVGLEAGVVLPIEGVGAFVDERLSVVAAGGWVVTDLSAPAIVPGRGYDAGFMQRTSVVPGELVLRWRLPLPASAPVELAAEAGFGLLGTWTTFRSFSKEEEQVDVAPAFVGALQLELPAGPGRALLRVADLEATAELGPLGPAAGAVGESSLSGLALALGYVVPFGG